MDSLDDVRSDKDLLSDSFDAVFSLNNSSLSLKPDPGSPKPKAEKKTAAAAPKLEITKPEEEAKTAASPKKVASAKKPQPAKSAGTTKS